MHYVDRLLLSRKSSIIVYDNLFYQHIKSTKRSGIMVNTPIPHSLKSEAKKAAKILKEFTVPTAKMGPDKLIPGGIFLKAKGLAILTVVKAGFLVTARGGSGIVIAKLDDGIDSAWSAPSAIGIAGLGGGFEIGAEVTDFVIILNKRSAVDAFSKGGNLTLGGNFTIAAGPVGRNLEADVALRSTAAIYTYSKTRGLFAGISVEGSGLIERKDANRKFYGRDIRAFEILRGDVDPPEECQPLYEALESHRKNAEKEIVRMAKKKAMEVASGEVPDLKSKFSNFTKSFKSQKKSREHTDGATGGSKQQYDSDDSIESPTLSRSATVQSRTTTTMTTKRVTKSSSPGGVKSSSGLSSWSSQSVHRKSSGPTVSSRGMQRPRSMSGNSVGSMDSWELTATALFPFEGQIACDLSFKAGEKITVLTRTDTQDDWWEGSCHGKIGIFPANYVKCNT
ncbi:SH3 domain-containing YSC84-like protein 1 isoform X2 [Dreissena polymorpha]|uniref:SH3 domain-containing YSC84-like protein 1 isoform X2 n=1 Tax=Dreissena polymorpha TaxID=45954 RepID=UPI0022654639|nr:SH3 domain-containing YSC84-like protein 1 isoform X2 [Dreissena polymorpha]